MRFTSVGVCVALHTRAIEAVKVKVWGPCGTNVGHLTHGARPGNMKYKLIKRH